MPRIVLLDSLLHLPHQPYLAGLPWSIDREIMTAFIRCSNDMVQAVRHQICQGNGKMNVFVNRAIRVKSSHVSFLNQGYYPQTEKPAPFIMKQACVIL